MNGTYGCRSLWDGSYWLVEEWEGVARGVAVVGVFDAHEVAVGVGVECCEVGWAERFRQPHPGPPPGGEGGRGAEAEQRVGEFDHRVHGRDFDFVAGLGIDDAAEVVEGGLEGLGEVGFAVVVPRFGEERDPGLDVWLNGPLEGFGGLDVEISGEVDEVGVDVGEEVEAVAVFVG